MLQKFFIISGLLIMHFPKFWIIYNQLIFYASSVIMR